MSTASDRFTRPGPEADVDAQHRAQAQDVLARRLGRGRPLARWRSWTRRSSLRLGVSWQRAWKRSIDIAASGAALIALSPALALLAALIKLHDGGPVIFWQTRIGRWGAEFQFPKFRSMVVEAEGLKDSLISHSHHGDSITFKMRADPRVTPIGRFLRRFSLDELPQLWCVLKGEMSLVGPRPPVPREVKLYRLADRRRLDVKPGLTCIWQVSGRGDIPFARQVELDVEYIDRQSTWLDLKLLLLTLPAVLKGRGAY